MNFQSKENRVLNPNEPLRIYRNLNNGKLSVQQVIPVPNKKKKDWRVIGWVDNMQLKDVSTFFERWKQDKAVATETRNVHAYIVGYMVGGERFEGQTKELTYNPFKYSEFVNKTTEQNIYQAETLFINKEGKMFYK